MRRWLDCLVVLIVGGGSFFLLSARTQPDARLEVPDRVQAPIADGDPAPALGETEVKLETAALGVGTNGVYRFRSRHPWLYGLVAFIAGGALAALFVAIPYLRTTFDSPDFKAALYEILIGGLGGGLAAVASAFAYTAAIRPTLGAMQASGIIGTGGSAIATPHPAE
jgi:hypothetical protein